MPHGHHGANHPVKNLITGKVEITSMNHGFAIDTDSLPNHVLESHVSLFDGSNCGIEIPQRNIFSVQYHPEAHPGPQDSYYLFKKFLNHIINATSKSEITTNYQTCGVVKLWLKEIGTLSW
jgi:carbamoyl-phosphate synthase small subunit